MTLFLTDQDVDKLVTMDDMLPAIEDMLRHHGKDEGYNLARRRVMAPTGELAVMAGGLFYQGVFGVKVYTVVKGGYSFHVSLYDASSGQLLAFMPANRLGQLRTGATTGVAVKYLAPQKVTAVGIIGTGHQAPTQLEAICKVRQVSRIKAWSPNSQRRREFASRASKSLGVKVKAMETNREAVEGCDLVVGIASNVEPVVEGSWLKRGVTVVGAGPATWRAQELDESALLKMDRIFVDTIEQAPYEAGDLARAVDKGLLQWQQVAELRRVVAGSAPGRKKDAESLYVKLMGTAVADVAAARLVWERAQERKVGREI
jgi:ornithine cyclodeaminase/alanine dehydrogenase-like protein (mu-crystallin family)